MACLDKLIKNHFLRNVNKEILEARNTLHPIPKAPIPAGTLPFRSKDRKKLYEYYAKLLDIQGSFDDVDVNEQPDMVYYLQEGPIAWVASRYKHLVDQTIKDSMYVGGEVSIYKGKKYIQSKLFYVAMYDLTFRIFPPTTN